MLRIQQQNGDNDRRRAARENRRGRRTGHAPFEAENHDRVARDVDDVDKTRNQHGNARVALCAEQRRAGVINRKHRIGEHAHGQIGQRVLHYAVRNRTEQQPQQRFAERHDERGDRERNHGHDQIELLCRVAGAFVLPCAEQLRHNDSAAGRKRGKYVDDKYVYHIDERNARYCRLAAGGHHDGVRKADRDGEHLLEHERPDELFECSVGEKLFFRGDCLLSYRITRYASTRRSNVHAAFAGLVEGSTVTGTWV